MLTHAVSSEDAARSEMVIIRMINVAVLVVEMLGVVVTFNSNVQYSLNTLSLVCSLS